MLVLKKATQIDTFKLISYPHANGLSLYYNVQYIFVNNRWNTPTQFKMSACQSLVHIPIESQINLEYAHEMNKFDPQCILGRNSLYYRIAIKKLISSHQDLQYSKSIILLLLTKIIKCE